MLREIEDLISKLPVRNVVDATFGAGGHTRLFKKLGCEVCAIDRDPFVKNFAISSVPLFIDTFSNIHKYVQEYDFLFADLGMSTMHLDSERGFSFMSNTPLEMHMEGTKSLKLILNRLSTLEIQRIIKQYGQEPLAHIIARRIESFRVVKDIETTFDLRDACGTQSYKVLARVFQAFRIYMNDEISELEKLCKIMRPNVGFAILTFHSLEDKIVKQFSKNFKTHGFLIPTQEEIENNPKSRSTKLRFGYNILNF